MSRKLIKIIGAGLAGSEAAWQLASLADQYKLNLDIELYEMRPQVKTPVHHTGDFAELVCSNSLGSDALSTARGLLIHEMEYFDSLIIKAARQAKVPAGQALAVDRELFGGFITASLSQHPRIKVVREEFEKLPEQISTDEILVIASGPLTTKALATSIQGLLGTADFLHFFDAASPILTQESINQEKTFRASRYGKGEDDYINCPFYDQEEFDNFYQALVAADRVALQDFEKENFRYFNACMPIEAIADRGKETLCFGPLKPVGLRDSGTPDRRPIAVVQLRQDNVIGSLYNIVGFQTNLKWSEQKRVFSLIPGLENLDIVRYGVMHQNIFINSPLFLNADMSFKLRDNIFFAGQITGVEGYTESAASGIIAARSIINRLLDRDPWVLPKETMMGALANYISSCDSKHFQPINANWGLLNPQPETLAKEYRKNKKLRQEFFVERARGLLKNH